MAAPSVPGDALEETFRSLRRVMLALKGRWHAALAAYGLTFPQWLVLKSVQRKGRMTVSELALTCESTAANVTGILDRLERDGLVTRSRSAEDRRVVYVRLTETGHDRIRTVEGDGLEVLREFFDGLDGNELAQLRGLLARVRLRPGEVEDL
jgi:DNA-binding MarR family transcriptional regulator